MAGRLHVAARLVRIVILMLLAVHLPPSAGEESQAAARPFGYIMFRVNPGEGFNLRKDALLRLSASLHELKDKWTLALPPIRWVPHWHDSPHLVPVVTGDRREDVQKARETGTWKWVAWSDLLNVDALRKYISVTTYDDFLAENGPELSTAVHMLSRKEIDFSKPLLAWMSDCSEWSSKNANYDVQDYTAPASIFEDCPLYTKEQECMIGPASLKEVRPLIDDRFAAKAREALSEGKKPYSMLLSRIEIMMWEFMWSTDDYWNARRHFVFAQELYDEARRFMQSVHIDDGKYMAIHMRRGDFVYAHGAKIPQLDEVAMQLRPVMEQRGLKKLFVATDATPADFEQLKKSFGDGVEVLNFKFSIARIEPGSREYHLTDGQIGIVDQILCAYADYFYGSMESTFSNTIYEERNLLGKSYDTTYNVLCPRFPGEHARAPDAAEGAEFACRKPTRWLAPNPVRHYILEQGPEAHVKDEL